MENQNSFFARTPFSQQRAYLLWLKVTGVLLALLIVVLLLISFKDYLAYHDLLLQKNSLAGTVAQLDEVVRKKNRLLSQGEQHNKRNKQKIYAKIAQYLTEIEAILIPGVQLVSFDFAGNKLELTGYSDDLTSLITMITGLEKLSFVKESDLQQIGTDVKVSNHKLAFTIVINL